MTLSMGTGVIKDIVHRGAVAAVNAAAMETIAVAQPLTPILEGALRASINQSETVESGGVVSTAVRSSLIYAARQHEETSWKHPRGGQAKYLDEARKQTEARLASIAAKHLGGRF